MCNDKEWPSRIGKRVRLWWLSLECFSFSVGDVSRHFGHALNGESCKMDTMGSRKIIEIRKF